MSLARSLALTVTLVATALPSAAQSFDPRDLVVMLEWRNFAGDEFVGAGVIVDQGASGTLIVTAQHNLVDENGDTSENLTVEFRSDPGRKAVAEPVYLSNRYDLGLVRVAPEASTAVLDSDASRAVLNLQAGGEADVYVVGYGGGRPWNHSLRPEPARWASVAEIVVESSDVRPGQSGGGVFDADWSLVGVVVDTDGSAARALPVGLVLDEIRTSRYGVALAPNAEAERDDARRALAGRNIAWTVDAVAGALASADLEVLDQFLAAGAGAALLTEALGRPTSAGPPAAAVFFERADDDGADWLGRAIEAGLDPNATVPDERYERIGLVNLALAAGNGSAVRALLEGGASPHGIQELWFTRPPLPSGLFPVRTVLRHTGLTGDEKRALVEALLEHGAVVPDASAVERGYYQSMAMEELPEQARSLASGLELRYNDPASLDATPVCRKVSTEGMDWCAFARSLPRSIAAPDPRRIDYGFWRLEIVAFLNATDDTAYLMGYESDSYGEPFSLITVSRDARLWQVYRYMSPYVGLGLCPEVDGIRPDECWRRLPLTHDPATGGFMLQDYYPYQGFPTRDGGG